MNEATVQANLRLLASQEGWRIWRNNVGVLLDGRGIPVRFGLANESAAVNQIIKSADLIGIKPGGQFVSRECKRPGWKFNPNNPRDVAQQRWMDLINMMGGDAKISTGEL
jgi:hypothetical protein